MALFVPTVEMKQMKTFFSQFPRPSMNIIMYFINSATTTASVIPRFHSLKEGESATLRCFCRGEVKWFINNTRNSIADLSVGGSKIEKLKLYNVLTHMGGKYTCYCKLLPDSRSFISNSFVRVQSKNFFCHNIEISIWMYNNWCGGRMV